ncbi:kinesin-like protein KIF12 [Lissotriton helveticus]
MSLFNHRSAAEEFADQEDIKQNNFSVAVRVRPLTNTEAQRGEKTVVYCPGESTLYVNHIGQEKVFRFDAVFDSTTSQEELFEESGVKRLIDLALYG